MERKQLVRGYLCGAHSTGKTTLLGDVCKELSSVIKKESEIARHVLDGMSEEDRCTSVDYQNYPEKFEELQRLILKTQCKVDSDNLKDQNIQGYIADRGIDPIVYAALYLGDKAKESLLALPVTQDCIKRYKKSCVFVVYPHKKCMKEDGMRIAPVWNELKQFTDILIKILNDLGIDYIPITVLDRKQRCEIVVDHIRRRLALTDEI